MNKYLVKFDFIKEYYFFTKEVHIEANNINEIVDKGIDIIWSYYKEIIKKYNGFLFSKYDSNSNSNVDKEFKFNNIDELRECFYGLTIENRLD